MRHKNKRTMVKLSQKSTSSKDNEFFWEKTSNEDVWRIFILVSLLVFTVLLTLNSTNVFPNRPTHRFSGTIEERNIIDGKAIQLHPNSGMQYKRIMTVSHGSKTLPTHGLSLARLPPKSILANASPDKSNIPQGLIMPTNSILISTDSGLKPLIATRTNTFLTFNGENIVWDTISYRMPTLKHGQLFIGDEDGNAKGVTLTGDVRITSTGQVTIKSDVITTDHIRDAHITPIKISNGEQGQVLTSKGGRPIWEYPQHDLRCHKDTEQMKDQSGDTLQFDKHQYTYHGLDEINENGQTVRISAFGHKIETDFPVKFGLRIQDVGQSIEDYTIEFPTEETEWKLEANIIRLTSNSGLITIQVWTKDNSIYSSRIIQSATWTGSLESVFIGDTDGSESVDGPITIVYSSADMERPRGGMV